MKKLTALISLVGLTLALVACDASNNPDPTVLSELAATAVVAVVDAQNTVTAGTTVDPTSQTLPPPTPTLTPTATQTSALPTTGNVSGGLYDSPAAPTTAVRHPSMLSAPTRAYGEWKGVGTAAFTIEGLPDGGGFVVYWTHDPFPDYSATPEAFRAA